MAIRLTPAAEAVIQVMNLQEEKQNTIRSCIAKYSEPHTFCEFLSWVANRIVNAVKSIFGNSDWDVAKGTIRGRALEMALERGLYQENPANYVEEAIKRNVLKTSDLAADGLLNMCLKVNHSLAVVPENFFQRIGLENVVNELGNVVQRIHQEIPMPQQN